MSPKFAPIGMNTLSSPASRGDVPERCRLPGSIQLQRRRVVRQPEIGARRFVDRREVAGREQVQPAVVVVVEEPGREAAARARARPPLAPISVNVPSWLLRYRKLSPPKFET